LFKILNGRLFKRWGVKLDTHPGVLIEQLDRLTCKEVRRETAKREEAGAQTGMPEIDANRLHVSAMPTASGSESTAIGNDRELIT